METGCHRTSLRETLHKIMAVGDRTQRHPSPLFSFFFFFWRAEMRPPARSRNLQERVRLAFESHEPVHLFDCRASECDQLKACAESRLATLTRRARLRGRLVPLEHRVDLKRVKGDGLKPLCSTSATARRLRRRHRLLLGRVDESARLRADDVRQVGRSDERDRASRTRVRVAQRVGQLLKVVRLEAVFVRQHAVVARASRADETSVSLEVKVEREWVADIRVDAGASGQIAGAVNVLRVLREEAARKISIVADGVARWSSPHVMTLRRNHERDLGLVFRPKGLGRFLDGLDLDLDDLVVLATRR